jgi:yecA family protein
LSSLSKRYRSALPDPGQPMPPNLSALGTAPFGDAQRTRLAAWLREAGWPRGHMDIVELEGYLVALIVWPVAISTGAWLPPVWGGRGWRVPKKIAARLQYDEFVDLVVAYMRELDRRLSQPSRFALSAFQGMKDEVRIDALHRWGRGFIRALTLGSQGLQCRNVIAGDAVRVIAARTSASAPFAPDVDEEIASAVIALTAQRASRGPLGPVDPAISRVAS